MTKLIGTKKCQKILRSPSPAKRHTFRHAGTGGIVGETLDGIPLRGSWRGRRGGRVDWGNRSWGSFAGRARGQSRDNDSGTVGR